MKWISSYETRDGAIKAQIDMTMRALQSPVVLVNNFWLKAWFHGQPDFMQAGPIAFGLGR